MKSIVKTHTYQPAVKVLSLQYTVQHFSCMAGASCSMAVLTLPVIRGAPPLLVFQVLEWLAIALVYALLGLAVVSILVLVIPLLMVLLCCVKPSSSTSEKEGLSCRRCMRTAFLFLGRRLCVNTFPALFKLQTLSPVTC